MEFERGKFYLGGAMDPGTSERTGDSISYDSDDLTTHGVIVGMTGSGKTGLGIDLIEEALASNVPCLIVDPKGDMGNLALAFPEFRGDDFLPWIDATEQENSGLTAEAFATKTAETWKKGLADWGIGTERVRRLAETGIDIYTPGSSAGLPVNALGTLNAPTNQDEEASLDEIEAYTSALLSLADIDSDPVSGREHILIANIIQRAWNTGESLDLETVLARILQPPFRKLGVFALDSFFPADARRELALRINSVLASPAFASWLDGVPLDMVEVFERQRRPARASVIYLSHLSDSERMAATTLILSKVVSWMRGQSGSSDLRALIYMDEVFGFCPPTAEPPSKKPILTILKQARAFGVGMVLSTQNPVDLDYKAMSNAGTWMIGRLQTERDKARILEGMQSASGAVDSSTFDPLISGLGKRQFVLHTSSGATPQVFGTRWAMSYLAGPLTRDEIKRLTPDQARAVEQAPPSPPPLATERAVTLTVGDDATPIAPAVADGVPVTYADPAAAWLAEIDRDTDALVPAAVATVHLLYDDQYADVDHREDFEAIIHPLSATVDDHNLHAVDHDPRDFRDRPPTAATYALVDQPIDTKSYWNELSRSLRDHLVMNKRITVWKNPALKLYSRVGEERERFERRCAEAAEAAADEEIAALKDRYGTRIDRVKDQISKAEHRVRDLESDVSAQRQEEVVSGAGDLLGAILGGRQRSSSISRAASRRSHTRKTEARLDTAIDTMKDKATDLIELEDELEADVIEITDRSNAAASHIEELEIPLEKTDVDVEPLSLVWLTLPTAS